MIYNERIIGRIFATLAIVCAIAFIAVPVLAAYYVDIGVTESNGTDYDMLAINASLDIDYLADNGYINATGLDVRVRSTGGAELPFMLCSDKVLFASSITGDLTNTFQLTTGNTPMSAFDIVTGYGGNITIADAAALELSNNFTIEFEAWIDDTTVHTGLEPTVVTTAENSHTSGTNHTVTLPSGLEAGDMILIHLALTSSPSDTTITTPPAGYTQVLYDEDLTYHFTNAIYYKIAGSSESTPWYVTDASCGSSNMALRVANAGLTVEAVLGAVVDVSANPVNPPAITPSSGNYSYLWIAGYGGRCNYYPTAAPSGYVGLDYRRETTEYSNTGHAYNSSVAATEDPSSFTFTGSGVDFVKPWTLAIQGFPIGYLYKDGALSLYKSASTTLEVMTRNLTATTTITAGEYKIEVVGNTTHLILELDDVVEDTAALNGVSVPDNSNSWTIAGLPYLDYYKHTTGGTLRITYDPDEILTGTTLDNESGASYDGTISFGSNPAGISVDTSGLEFTPASYYTTTDDTTAEVITPRGINLIDIDTAKLDRNPLRLIVELIVEISDDGVTERIVWIVGSLLLVLAAALGTLVFTKGKVDLMTIVATGLSIGFYIMGSLPLFVPVLCAIGLVAAEIRSHQVSY